MFIILYDIADIFIWRCVYHLSLAVHCQVVHLRHIHQFNGVTGKRSSDVTLKYEVLFNLSQFKTKLKAKKMFLKCVAGVEKMDWRGGLPNFKVNKQVKPLYNTFITHYTP